MDGDMNVARIQYVILGTILVEPSRAGEVIAKLKAEDFNMISTRGLFDAISTLYLKGAPIDPVTVLQEAGGDYEPAVAEVIPYATDVESLGYYCDLLREQSQLLAIQREAFELSVADTLEAAGKRLDRINGLMVTRKRVEIVSASQAALDFYARQDDSAPKPEYLPWGIKELDDVLYAELGDFIVVGGYPSAGKTLLSVQFALKLAAKYRVGYFSLETSPKKLVDRIMSHMAQVPLGRIKKKELYEGEWTAIADAASRLSSLHFDCIDAGGMSVRDIQAVALNQRYQVIVVDYLQLIADAGKGRYEQVTNISQALHTLARSNGIAVIALAQLRRPDKENGKMKPPTMSDFRESGQIEQDADIALLLWPSDPNDNKSRRVLKVGKNKDGDRTKLELDFNGSTQTMTPAVLTPGEQYRKTRQAIAKAAKEARANQQTTFTDLGDYDDPDAPF